MRTTLQASPCSQKSGTAFQRLLQGGKIRMVPYVAELPLPGNSFICHKEEPRHDPWRANGSSLGIAFASGLHGLEPDSRAEQFAQSGPPYSKIGKNNSIRIGDRTDLRPGLGEELAALIQLCWKDQQCVGEGRIGIARLSEFPDRFPAEDSAEMPKKGQQGWRRTQFLLQRSGFEI